MIKSEIYIDENGIKHEDLVRTFSNKGKVIKQVETGVEYDEAIDTLPIKFTYVETDKDVEIPELIEEKCESGVETPHENA